jgi:TIR domain
MPYDYDLFISYTSYDRAWASKLQADLSGRRVKCFFDQLRLTKGEKWEPQLLSKLVSSRHFLVLWSDKARHSDWVSEELYRFKAQIDPKGEGQIQPGHFLWAINLEGQNATLASYQSYQHQEVQGDYRKFLSDAAQAGAPPQTIALSLASQQLWDLWVSEIAAAATSNNPPIPMPVAVLALTTEVLRTSPPLMPELSFVADPDLDTFLERVGTGKMTQLAARYGQTPLDWRPTGTTETVKVLLDALLSDRAMGINAKLTALHQPPVQWKHVDVVTPPLDQLEEVTKPLASGPCLVIVDPVSLFSLRIYQRYVKLSPCFANPQAAIAFLSPLSTPPDAYLRQCLSEQGKPNLAWYNDPIPHNPLYANCGIAVGGKNEIRRLVLVSLGRHVTIKAPSGGEHIVN